MMNRSDCRSLRLLRGLHSLAPLDPIRGRFPCRLERYGCHRMGRSEAVAEKNETWPDDVEVPLGGDFVDFGELTADDARAIADEIDANTWWGLTSAAESGRPTTEARLWRGVAAELDEHGAQCLGDLPFEHRERSAHTLQLGQRGWALSERRQS